MKIISWNCNMAFRNKAGHILRHKPDILVVIECEHLSKMTVPSMIGNPTDSLWFGNNQHKGLAVFSYGDFRFKVHASHNDNFKMIIPIEVSGGPFEFNLFIVWAYNPGDTDGRYVTQVWKAMKHYDELLGCKPTLLVGDFNSNTIWDKKNPKNGSHSEVVRQLEAKKIHSTYHLHHKQQPGKERHPTFYLYRHQDKPYHLDYCFASEDLLARLKSVKVGGYDAWKPYSDHVPLIVNFND